MAVALRIENLDLFVLLRITQLEAYDEPIELRRRKRIRAVVFNRILRYDDEGRRLQRVGDTFNRRL